MVGWCILEKMEIRTLYFLNSQMWSFKAASLSERKKTGASKKARAPTGCRQLGGSQSGAEAVC